VHLRGGAEQVLGRFPWHKAAFVGGTATLRGFDEQRFSGDAAVYGGGEARLRILKPRVVVPLAVGAFGFVDGGRVFLDGESPEDWHTSAGGGLYLQPAQQAQLVRIGIAQSDEATKFFILFGLPY
jgi:hemolysin activation/secretion protein